MDAKGGETVRLFHASYNGRNGSLRKTKTWYAELRDPLGITRRFALFTDERQSQRAAERIEKLIVCTMNSEPPGRELSEWLERIPNKLRDRLAKVGILDPVRAAASKTLAQHLEDFAEVLKVGNTRKHVEDTCSRIRRVCRACGFQYWSDISASRVKVAIWEFRKSAPIVEKIKVAGEVVKRKTHKDLGPLSDKSKNYHLTAFKQFCRWMVKDRRALESPVEYLDKIKYVDDEHRRALSADEVCRLLVSTEAAPKRFGMAGHERAVLYLVTVETGLRVKELRSLKVSSFDLDQAAVTVEAKRCKNRREAVQLLRRARLKPLSEFFAGRGAGDRAFSMPTNHYTADMLKADLAAADIEHIDDAGRKADFHCLRHTLATALDQTGASIKERMTIMRHSDRSNLTLGIYTHVQPYNIRRAIENLPDYSWPGQKQSESQTLAATGTDGRTVLPENLSSTGGKIETTMDSGGQMVKTGVDCGTDESPTDGVEKGDSDLESHEVSDTGPVAQRQSSGLIIHWS